jgi:hypothetical protein
VDEQVNAGFVISLTQLTGARIWPPAALKIVCHQASSVNGEPHEELAPSWGLRSLDWSCTGEALVGHEEEVVRTACGEVAVAGVAPDQGISSVVAKLHLKQLIPEV